MKSTFRTAALAVGASLLVCGAFSLTRDAATANQELAATDLTLKDATGAEAIRITREGPKNLRAGEEFRYKLVLTNVSNKPLTGIRVTETASGVELRSADDGAAQVNGGQLSFNAGQLAPGDSRALTVTARAADLDAAGKPVRARSCVVVDFNPALCTEYVVTQPDLKLAWTLFADREIEAECRVPGIYSCDDLFIVYKVTNTGSGPTEPVVLTQNLPAGLQTADGKSAIKTTLKPLAAGESKELRVPLMLDEEAAGQTLDLSAEANAGGITASTDSKSIGVLNPALDLRIDGVEKQYIGRPVEMTFTVTNTSDAPALNTVVAVTEPDGVNDFRLDTRDYDGEAVIIGCLQPGQSRSFKARFDADDATEVDVTARALAYCVDEVEKSLAVKYEGISAILIETVDKVDPVKVGSNTTYEIFVKNQGSAPDLNINLTGTLPDGLTFVSDTGDSDVTVQGQNLTFGKIDELAPGDVASWNVTVKAEKADKVRFKLELTSDANPEPVQEEEPTTLY